MTENLAKLMETSKRTIAVANDLLQACHQKEEKVYSHSGSAVSFFIVRGSEMFESFLILVEKERILDCALILRSFLDMGMTLAYIFSKGIEETESERRALLYLIEGDKDQLKLANSNRDALRKSDKAIDERIDELKKRKEGLEAYYKSRYGDERPEFPFIEQRAILSNYEVMRKVYDQAYRILSFVDHHSFFIGGNYVNMDKCEPLKEIDIPKHFPQLRLVVSLLSFKSMFIEILSVFNDVYHLGKEERILEIRALQIAELDSSKTE